MKFLKSTIFCLLAFCQVNFGAEDSTKVSILGLINYTQTAKVEAREIFGGVGIAFGKNQAFLKVGYSNGLYLRRVFGGEDAGLYFFATKMGYPYPLYKGHGLKLGTEYNRVLFQKNKNFIDFNWKVNYRHFSSFDNAFNKFETFRNYSLDKTQGKSYSSGIGIAYRYRLHMDLDIQLGVEWEYHFAAISGEISSIEYTDVLAKPLTLGEQCSEFTSNNVLQLSLSFFVR